MAFIPLKGSDGVTYHINPDQVAVILPGEDPAGSMLRLANGETIAVVEKPNAVVMQLSLSGLNR